jgi:hypothetical protein
MIISDGLQRREGYWDYNFYKSRAQMDSPKTSMGFSSLDYEFFSNPLNFDESGGLKFSQIS